MNTCTVIGVGEDTKGRAEGTAEMHVVCDAAGHPAAVLVEVRVANPFGVDDGTAADAFLRGLELAGFARLTDTATTLEWEPEALAGLGRGSLTVAGAGTTLFAGGATLPAPLVAGALHTGVLAVLVTTHSGSGPGAVGTLGAGVDLGALAAGGRLVGALCSTVLTDRPGRNERCWCGSGQKWKRCCQDRYAAAVAQLAAARAGSPTGP